jgi:hypothetical protein
MLDSFLLLVINEISLVSVQRVAVRNFLHTAQSRILLLHGKRHFRQHFGLDELGCDRRVIFLCGLKKIHHALGSAVFNRFCIDLFYIY